MMTFRTPMDDEIAQLPKHHGEILRAFQEVSPGYGKISYRAISERLGIPIGTVKSRLNRARLVLKEKRDLAAAAQVVTAGLEDAVGGNG